MCARSTTSSGQPRSIRKRTTELSACPNTALHWTRGKRRPRLEHRVSPDLRIEREAHARALDHAVTRAVGILERKPGVHLAVLFGSYAEGRRDLFTDVDLLVVMDSELGFIER